MAELSISPAEIRSALNEFVSSYRATDVAGEEVGQVVFAADGIATWRGWPAPWPTSCCLSKTAP